MSSSHPDVVIQILQSTLQLNSDTQALHPGTLLLGSIPELDSMAVIGVITAIEDHFDIVVEDDEISADVFESVATLASFVASKVE